jgi:transposase
VKVLERLLGGSMSSAEAAEILGVTCRQLRRLKSKYAKEGKTNPRRTTLGGKVTDGMYLPMLLEATRRNWKTALKFFLIQFEDRLENII